MTRIEPLVSDSKLEKRRRRRRRSYPTSDNRGDGAILMEIWASSQPQAGRCHCESMSAGLKTSNDVAIKRGYSRRSQASRGYAAAVRFCQRRGAARRRRRWQGAQRVEACKRASEAVRRRGGEAARQRGSRRRDSRRRDSKRLNERRAPLQSFASLPNRSARRRKRILFQSADRPFRRRRCRPFSTGLASARARRPAVSPILQRYQVFRKYYRPKKTGAEHVMLIIGGEGGRANDFRRFDLIFRRHRSRYDLHRAGFVRSIGGRKPCDDCSTCKFAFSSRILLTMIIGFKEHRYFGKSHVFE